MANCGHSACLGSLTCTLIDQPIGVNVDNNKAYNHQPDPICRNCKEPIEVDENGVPFHVFDTKVDRKPVSFGG